MRLARVQFTLRTIMAAVVVMGLISGGYVGLIRFGPALSKAQRNQLIVAEGAEAAEQKLAWLVKAIQLVTPPNRNQ